MYNGVNIGFCFFGTPSTRLTDISEIYFSNLVPLSLRTDKTNNSGVSSIKLVLYFPDLNCSCRTTFFKNGMFVLIPRILNSFKLRTILIAAWSNVNAQVDNLTNNES